MRVSIREKDVFQPSREWQIVFCLRVFGLSRFFRQRQTLRTRRAPAHRRFSERHDARDRAGHFGQLVGGGRVHQPALHQLRRPDAGAGHGRIVRVGARRPRVDVPKQSGNHAKKTACSTSTTNARAGTIPACSGWRSIRASQPTISFSFIIPGSSRARSPAIPILARTRFCPTPTTTGSRVSHWTRTAWPFPAPKRCSLTKPTRPSGTTAAACFFIPRTDFST